MFHLNKKKSELHQEMPQSQTTDQLKAPRWINTEQSHPHDTKNQAQIRKVL